MWMRDYGEEDDPEPTQTTPLYHRRFSVHWRTVGSGFEPLIICYATKEHSLQVVSGVDAEVVVSTLPVSTQHTPRCWVVSSDGALVAIGYEEGMIQVHSNKTPPLGYHCVGVVAGTVPCGRVDSTGSVEEV